MIHNISISSISWSNVLLVCGLVRRSSTQNGLTGGCGILL